MKSKPKTEDELVFILELVKMMKNEGIKSIMIYPDRRLQSLELLDGKR